MPIKQTTGYIGSGIFSCGTGKSYINMLNFLSDELKDEKVYDELKNDELYKDNNLTITDLFNGLALLRYSDNTKIYIDINEAKNALEQIKCMSIHDVIINYAYEVDTTEVIY